MRQAFRLLLILLSLTAFGGCSTDNNRPASSPATTPSQSVTTTSQIAYLHLPPGFQISVYATHLHSPRFMIVDPSGNLLVAERSAGTIVALPPGSSPQQSGGPARVLVSGLNDPTSLFFHAGYLYIGERTSIDRLTLSKDLHTGPLQRIVPDLPEAGQHNTRTVLIGPDNHMYVSIGSSCNVCQETNPHRAAIWQYALDGSQGHLYAKGLRNAVGLAINPWNQQIWLDVNGRDMLGDNLPPETVYTLTTGDYGWPRCHAGTIKDPRFGQSTNACTGVQQPLVTMQAHSAPLGLDFYPPAVHLFPVAYRNSLYIAFHGSWNRSVPTGYKVVRIPLKNGTVAGPPTDFITGWLSPKGAENGRPAGVTFAPDGSLFISDDTNSKIYHVWYRN